MRKTAIVTGCAKGIGKSIALDLARDGYNIIGTYNTSYDEVINLKNHIENIGVNCDLYKVDLSIEEAINNFCQKINDNYKNIDVLINNAALSLDCEFENKTKDEFIKVLEVNLIAPFLLIQKLNITDVIINIASTDGINTYTKYNIDYSASKAALINLTKSLSLILSSRIYALCPNWVNTESVSEMNSDYLKEELKRVGQSKLIEPSEVSNRVLSLILSNKPSGSVIVMEE